MIITALEVQTILGLTGQLDEIEKRIPLAESYAFNYTKNYFHTALILTSAYFHDNEIEIDAGINTFQKDTFIHIQNSVFNNGFYQITEVDGNILTVDATLLNEENTNVFIFICKIEQGFKIALAKFINSLLASDSGAEKTTEKIGDYSYTSQTTVNTELPLAYFNPYRKAKVT